ncbi:MAG TPA: sterol desaturase family protein [Candidatus Limnocylindrales bacterium]|nr:sterol desaturase family protein [Candidatus Limnocylindrales bacterium]
MAIETMTAALVAWLAYCAGYCVRYFGVAGALTWLLHGPLRARLLRFRIQREFPSRRSTNGEILWSISNAACTGIVATLSLGAVQGGYTRMYFDVSDHGIAYAALSALVVVLGYDTWFYWQHRLLHTRWMFERVHAVHHRSTNPTPLATFAHHPVETLLGNAYFVLVLLALPMHPLSLAAAGGAIWAIGLVAHLGYELYPRGFVRHPLLGWFNTATHHNLHHTEIGCDYGMWLNCWDRWMGTNHPAYAAVFEAATQRRPEVGRIDLSVAGAEARSASGVGQAAAASAPATAAGA